MNPSWAAALPRWQPQGESGPPLADADTRVPDSSTPVPDRAILGLADLWPFAIEVCAANDTLWLRGATWSASLDRALRMIPGAERYPRLRGGCGVPPGSRVPARRLPSGPWTRLRDWLTIAVPKAAFPPRCERRVDIRLVPCCQQQRVNTIIVSLDAWCRYAQSAPRLRLDRLVFAVDRAGRAIIRGEPVPPLRGELLVEASGIAVPAGTTWSPRIEVRVLRSVLRVEENALALLRRDGTYECVARDEFVRATRSAARLTRRAIHGS